MMLLQDNLLIFTHSGRMADNDKKVE